MKKLLLLLTTFSLYANSTNYNHTHVGVGYSGQTKDISNFYNQTDLGWKNKRNHVGFTATTNFSIQGGNVTNTNGAYRLGYDFTRSFISTLFVFNQSFLNPVSEVNFRNDVGFGMKTYIIKKDSFTLDISAAPVFTYSKYVDYYMIKGGASFRIKSVWNVTDLDSLSLSHFYIIGGDYNTFNTGTFSYYRQFDENLFVGLDTMATHESLTNAYYYNINAAFGIKL
jgi:hypothetical protein